jgi:hypothetical protein
MADDVSLQELEDFEKLLQHKIDLLNQADQILKQEQEAISNFATNHPHFSTYGHAIKDAVSDVESVLTDTILKHNAVVAKVQEAKTAAQQYEPDSI